MSRIPWNKVIPDAVTPLSNQIKADGYSNFILTHSIPMSPSYYNQSIDWESKLVDWFIHGSKYVKPIVCFIKFLIYACFKMMIIVLQMNYSSNIYDRYLGIFKRTFIWLTTLQSKVSKCKGNHAQALLLVLLKKTFNEKLKIDINF